MLLEDAITAYVTDRAAQSHPFELEIEAFGDEPAHLHVVARPDSCLPVPPHLVVDPAVVGDFLHVPAAHGLAHHGEARPERIGWATPHIPIHHSHTLAHYPHYPQVLVDK